jgi:hypothetical protein
VEYFPVPGPGILPQFVDRPNDSLTQRIEMDVLHGVKKILGLVYDRGLVPVLEEMAYALVPFVEIFRKSR